MHVFLDKTGKVHKVQSEMPASFEARFIDKWNSIKRGPQIITQKDAGFILSKLGISAGWRIVEAGSGSGALTAILANSVQPQGKIYSYDIKKEHLELAKQNVTHCGVSEYVEFKQGDVTKKIEEQEIDAIILDLPTPWDVISQAEKSLKKGGFLVVYTPTYEQLKKTYAAIETAEFTTPEVFTIQTQKIKVSEKITRPENTGLMFTAFLVFSRKI